MGLVVHGEREGLWLVGELLVLRGVLGGLWLDLWLRKTGGQADLLVVLFHH